MITIQIGSVDVPIEQADASWINQQINRRRADGAPVCVQVNITEHDVNIRLRTSACANGPGGGRSPNARERRVFELWDKRGLNRTEFTGGEVVAFLHQVRSLL